MNLLHRVFYGRVAKPRPTSTDRHQGNKSKPSSWSPTQSCRQVRSFSPCAGSATTVANTPGDLSVRDAEPYQITAAIQNITIKEEDEVDAVPISSAQGDHNSITASIGQPDRHIATRDESSQSTYLVASVKAESSEEGSFEGHTDKVGSLVEEGLRSANDGKSNENATGTGSFNIDEPIPSIEEDDDDGDIEQSRIRKKTPPFLHGVTRRSDFAFGSNPKEDIDEGCEGDDFEEELGREVEEDLLIDDTVLRYWLHHTHSTAGMQNWPSEACRLYKLLFLRGLYPMFGSQWIWNFLDHPMPDELFTPLGSDDKCLLKAAKSEYHASKALIRLFDLHTYVSDYRQCGTQERIAPLIEKEIKRYIFWAEKDGDFVKKHDYVSPVFIITYKDAQAASTGQPIVERCQTLAEEYRSFYAARDIRDYPRCIFVFLVVQHIILVMVADTDRLDEEELYPLAELDLSQRSHWLDYSLGIAITVMLAKESLLAHRWAFPTIQVVEDDPDL